MLANRRRVEDRRFEPAVTESESTGTFDNGQLRFVDADFLAAQEKYMVNDSARFRITLMAPPAQERLAALRARIMTRQLGQAAVG